MKKFEFKIPESAWNYVAEKGLPEEDDWCFLICDYRKDGNYSYEIGGYNKEKKSFYVNFGLGGLVITEEVVVAWVKLFDEDDYLKVTD